MKGVNVELKTKGLETFCFFILNSNPYNNDRTISAIILHEEMLQIFCWSVKWRPFTETEDPLLCVSSS